MGGALRIPSEAALSVGADERRTDTEPLDSAEDGSTHLTVLFNPSGQKDGNGKGFCWISDVIVLNEVQLHF